MSSDQKYIDKTLKFLNNCNYLKRDELFIEELAKFLNELFPVDYVLINKYSILNPNVTETLVVYNRDEFVSNISYELANTPCENVINNKICTYKSNIQQLFPKDELLVSMNVESYVGIPLWSSKGEPIGLIALMDSKPIENAKTIETIVQIAAIKASQVLEKTIFENILKIQINDLKQLSNKSKETEQLVKNSEEKFSKAFYSHPTAMQIVNVISGERLEANDSYLKLFGYHSYNEYLDGNIFENELIIKPEIVNKNNEKLLKKGFFKNSSFDILSKSGKIKNLVVSGSRLDSEEGNLAIISFLDITSQIKSDDKFKKLSNLTFEGVLIHNNGVAVDLNLSFLKMFGYKSKELIGKNIIDLLFPKRHHQFIFKSITKKYTRPYEIEGIRKDGTIFPVEVEAREIGNDDDTFRVAAFRDITTRKEVEQETNKLHIAVEQSANSIVITDLVGNIEYTNKKFTDVTGYTAEEVLGKNPRILNSGIQSKEYYKEMWQTLLSGKTWEGHLQNRAKNGELFWEQATISPIKSEKGVVTNYLAIKEDITKRKQAELELIGAYEIIKEKQDYLTNLLKITNEGFWTINTEAITLEVNPEMCNILGLDEKEIIGRSIFDFVDSKNTTIFKEELNKRDLGLSSSYEIELLKSDGSSTFCLFKTSPIYNKQNIRIGSFAMVTDISDLKKAYELSESQNYELRKLSLELSEKNSLLLESTSRFKNLFEQSPVSIWEQDFSVAIDLIRKKNAETEDIRKYLDENPEFINTCVSKIEILNVNKATLELLGVKSQEELITHIRKTNNIKAFETIKDELLDLVFGNQEFIGESEFIRADGEVVSVMVKSTLIDSKGKVIASVINITALKKAIEKAEESDRLKTEFLNNMSHEIRTPMNGILGFSQMLVDPDLDNKKRKNFVSIIQNSGNQLLHIIDDILEISRLGTKQVKVISEEICLNDILLDLFSIFDIKAKENKTPLYLKKELSDKQSTILSDKYKLNKILSNLLENALKFTNEGFIEFGYRINYLNGTEELEIYVKDTGIGIKKELQEHIFERFSQAEKELTKKVGGLGLGLSIAKENTELIGGKLTVKSAEMEGSTFSVFLPFKPIYSIDLNTEPTNELKILIAEDDEINFVLLETILYSFLKIKCNIFHVKNGLEAVEFCKYNHNIDFILMDLKMPLLSGFEATKQIKLLYPNIPIIAQTAYSTPDDKLAAELAGCNDFISKPIDKNKLISIIENYIPQE